MTPVQLESPYAGHVHRNKAYLQLCIRDCFERGEAPFASHQLYVDALDDDIAIERKQGIEAGLIWGKFAERTVVYTDFGISSGMKHGILAAEKLRRPCIFRTLKDFDRVTFYTATDELQETDWHELLTRCRSVR
jgi:hypothetical protein